MFDAFVDKRTTRDSQRLSMSLGISLAGFLALIGGVVAASAAVRPHLLEETLVQVKYMQPPEPPAPAQEAAAAAPAGRPSPKPQLAKPKARTLVPKAVPLASAQESDGELASEESGGGGGTGGSGTAVTGNGTASTGTTTAAPKRSVLVPPMPSPNNAAPEFPRTARRAGLQGVVAVRIWVQLNGRVGKIEILSGPEIFYEAVREALARWTYKPGTKDGVPVESVRVIHVPFTLND